MEKEKLVKLVIEAQNDNSEAMNQLFNSFYNDVYYFALKTVKNEDTACDITQETFVEIIKTIKNLQEPAAFVTWMKQITYHQCTRYFKKKKDVLVDEAEDESTIFDTVQEDRAEFIPDEGLEQDEFKRTILSIIDELTEEQRSAIMMYYFDELSVNEIAEIQGVSTGTVKSRLNYGRKAIKNAVEEYEEKNGIKLHAISFFPLFKLLFKDTFNGTMATTSAQAVAAEVSSATGVSVSAGTTTAATVTAATTATSVASSVTTGAVIKATGISLTTKIVAGIVAATVAVGGTIAIVSRNSKGDDTPTTTIMQTGDSDVAADNAQFTDDVTDAPHVMTEEEIETQLKGMASDFIGIKPFNTPSEIEDVEGICFLFHQAEWDESKITVETVQEFEYYYYDVYTIPVEEYEKQAQRLFGRSFDFKAIDGYEEDRWDIYTIFRYKYNEDSQTISIDDRPLNAGDIGYPSETLFEITKISENTYRVKKTEIEYFSSAPEDASRIYKEYKASDDYPGVDDGYLCYMDVVEKTFTLVDGEYWRFDSYVVIKDYTDTY